MDYLQYFDDETHDRIALRSFKPYYKWITFNTLSKNISNTFHILSFKPYYKWITFNT